MENKKDNQRGDLVVEIFAWVCVIGIVYMFAKLFF